ncbi:hypothetical protein QJS10_CPA09g00776 [Acorus calamus]|uniref:Uncharacterized protein n=1 Tax=Acorus calamus TaxID=4465 RepID=A0AAV9E5A2_ACOCL|nr:hypothetical protein QJS10_CPA09g00776 [Acorus calamus]
MKDQLIGMGLLYQTKKRQMTMPPTRTGGQNTFLVEAEKRHKEKRVIGEAEKEHI